MAGQWTYPLMLSVVKRPNSEIIGLGRKAETWKMIGELFARSFNSVIKFSSFPKSSNSQSSPQISSIFYTTKSYYPTITYQPPIIPDGNRGSYFIFKFTLMISLFFTHDFVESFSMVIMFNVMYLWTVCCRTIYSTIVPTVVNACRESSQQKRNKAALKGHKRLWFQTVHLRIPLVDESRSKEKNSGIMN